MSMENSGVPIRLEKKSNIEVLREEIYKVRNGLRVLGAIGAAMIAVMALNSQPREKPTGVSGDADWGNDKTEEVKSESWSHTTPETTSEILDMLDKKLVLGDVSEEQMERLNEILKENEEYHQYLKNLNTNPDGGTIETGGPVIGSEQTDKELNKNK
jgi:hypothetical protein